MSRPPAGLTDRVRRELSRLPPGDRTDNHAELTALLRLGGAVWRGDDGGGDVVVSSNSGATVRRAYALIRRRYGVRPELRVTAPRGSGGRASYGLRLPTPDGSIARELGLAGDGRVDPDPPAPFLRGALITAGTVSGPDPAPHLEIAVGDPSLAERLAVAAGRWLDATVTAPDDGRDRVVVKSGAAIGELLGRVGATRAYLDWEERRLRRKVRADATRLANADAANVRRTIEAAAEHTAEVERALDAVGLEGLDAELREVALARLANPSASLAELGDLCDPPVGKSAVHRRLRRLGELAEVAESGSDREGPRGGTRPARQPPRMD